MRVTLGDVLVYLRGDDKQLKESFDDAEIQSRSAGNRIGDVFAGALKIGVTAAGAAIVGIGAAAIDIASEVKQAQNDLRADFGLTEERAQQLGNVAKKVFGNNFADNFTDAAKAVGLVDQQLRGLAKPEDFQRITESAFRLRDAFGVEINEGVSAAKTLMENFGISSDRAFDLIAAGFQRGLNRSDDFLDTIGEYSVQFAAGGASAEEFFGLLDSGLQGGMLGTDKAADAFKEFRVRIADGSDLTAESLKMLGLSAEEITTKLANGTLTAADAFDMVIQQLQLTDDPVKRFQAGVGLIGTQFEDLGDAVATNLDLTADWAEGVDGSVTKIDTKYNNLGSAMEGMRRKFLLAIEPLGAGLLGIINDNLPAINSAIDGMAAGVTTAITNLKTGWDTDWGGIRTTLTDFSSDAPPILQEMWDEIDLMFQQEGDEVGDGWERFWGGMAKSSSDQSLNMLQNTSDFLRDLRILKQLYYSYYTGDQEGYNQAQKELWQSWGDQLKEIVDGIFGEDSEIRETISNFFSDWGARIAEQWRNLFILPDWLGGGSLLPQSAPLPNPDLGVINPLNVAGSNITTNNTPITINVTGGGDPFATGRDIGGGIQHVMRMRGG